MTLTRNLYPAVTAILMLLLGVLQNPLIAQDQPETPPPQQLTEAELNLQRQLNSPRSTFETFFVAMENEDIETARSCLDLSNLDAATASTKGATYAVKLHQVLNKLWDRSFYLLPEDPDTEPPFELGATLKTIDQTKQRDAKRIQLFKTSGGLWKFSQSTLNAVDEELWNTWYNPDAASQEEQDASTLAPPVWIESKFPAALRTQVFLLKTYQWICLAFLVVAGFIVGWVARVLLNLATNIWFHFRVADPDHQSKSKLWRPVSLIAHAATWYYGALLIDLPPSMLSVLLICFRLFAVIAIIWTSFRAINLLTNYMNRRAESSAGRFDNSLVPLIGNSLRILTAIVGIVLFVNVFGVADWKAVLGGFGIGGVAIAIAAKDWIGNIFGSITVLTDRPFEIGDTVVIDNKVEGTVEKIGIRSSRIRTYYQSEVIVPNSLLTTAIVDNLGRRRYRRFKIDLSLRFDTPTDRLESFCAGIRHLLDSSPHVPDVNAQVFVNDFTDNSISVLVNCYIDSPDWRGELGQRHQLLTGFLKLAERLSVEFAYPTRSIVVSRRQPSETPDGLPEQGVLTREQLQEFGQKIAGQISEYE